MSNDKQTPVIERPRISGLETSGPFKCVQLVFAEQDYLRMDRTDINSHHDILQTVLEEFGLDPKKFLDKKSSEGCFLVNTDQYRVVGMGYELLRAERMFVFNGRSEGYDLGIDKDHLIRLKPYFPEKSIILVNGEELK